MATNLNAESLDFATEREPVATSAVQADVQINHAALAAMLCALVLIGILMLPKMYGNALFGDTNQPLGPSQEQLVQGFGW